MPDFYAQRVARFGVLKNDPFYGKDLAKLNHDEINFITAFFVRHAALDRDKYTMQVNRIGLRGYDQVPNPKKQGVICDILLACRINQDQEVTK